VSITVRSVARGVRFEVRVQPRASRSEIVGEQEGALRVRLAAPPVDGAANDALIALLADLLNIPKRDIRIVSGATSKRKIIEAEGVSAAQVVALNAPRAP
jgi:uncharacterized protein (TIGR00251 family)